jgi:methylated-DNA-[protein]-cysteine S-methyltransferase
VRAVHHHLFATPFGEVALVWEQERGEPRIIRVFVSAPGLRAGKRFSRFFPESQPGACREVRELARNLNAFLAGNDVRFDLRIATLKRCSHFQRAVLVAEYRIPRGRVSTYGRIAAHLGMPRAARAVGRALAQNPFPLIIPCHRAIRSDGHLGGYQGGLTMKRALLAHEGVKVSARGRVVAGRMFYEA